MGVLPGAPRHKTKVASYPNIVFYLTRHWISIVIQRKRFQQKISFHHHHIIKDKKPPALPVARRFLSLAWKCFAWRLENNLESLPRSLWSTLTLTIIPESFSPHAAPTLSCQYLPKQLIAFLWIFQQYFSEFIQHISKIWFLWIFNSISPNFLAYFKDLISLNLQISEFF